MATRILITDGLAEEGLAILKRETSFEVDCRKATPATDLARILPEYDCVVIRSATTLTPELIDQGSRLKLIVRAGAGVDNIAVPRATEKKIPVMNTASANSLAAAELTIALMLGAFRQLGEASASLKAGKWERDKFKGREVTGKTLGLLGLGNIGGIVAQKAMGLGMRVIAFDPARKGLSGVTLVNTPLEVAKEADVLSVHVPKIKTTENLVNAELLSAMKNGSYLVNCARGGVVDEAAVIAALDSGKLAGAAFDVFIKEPPVFPNALIAHPKVLAVPHLGASTVEAQDRVALTAAQQMVGFFTRGDRTGVINP